MTTLDGETQMPIGDPRDVNPSDWTYSDIHGWRLRDTAPPSAPIPGMSYCTRCACYFSAPGMCNCHTAAGRFTYTTTTEPEPHPDTVRLDALLSHGISVSCAYVDEGDGGPGDEWHARSYYTGQSVVARDPRTAIDQVIEAVRQAAESQSSDPTAPGTGDRR